MPAVAGMAVKAGAIAEAVTRSVTGSGRRRPSVLALVILLVPLVVLLIAAWDYRWMSDDGFINLRVISQIRAGHGPVFNAGERVEPFTSPLWLLVLLVADLALPLRLEYLAVGLGIALTVGGVALAMLGAARLHQDAEPRVWLPAGVLVLVVFPAFWKMASSGLESGLTFAWLGGCLAVLATWAACGRPLRLRAAALLGLGPLIRPEFTLLSVGFVGVVIASEWTTSRGLHRPATLAAAFGLPIAYEVFRMGYYASLVPNSALAKEGFGSYWSAGWDYLHQTLFDTYALWVPLVLLAAAAYVPLVLRLRAPERQRARLVTIAFTVGGIVDAVYIVRVGGDFISSRLLLPSLFLLVAPIAIVPATRQFLGALLVVPWSLVVLIGVRSVYDRPSVLSPTRTNQVTTEDFGKVYGTPQRSWFTGAGAYFAPVKLPGRSARSSPVVASYGIGVIGYALGTKVYVLDLFGLGDQFGSHLQLERRGAVAHEKPLPAPWIAARLVAPGSPVTEREFPTARFSAPLDHPGHEPFAARVRDARRALRCPELADFFANYQARLTPDRFLDNLGRSFTNLSFRIPPEPRDAISRFCPKHR